MTENQARKIKLGVPVFWDGNFNDRGYVVNKDKFSLFICWDNGQYGWIHNKDLHRVHLQQRPS